MTDATARTVANVVVASAAVAAAYVIITTPPLRRALGRAIRIWLGSRVPAHVMQMVREAWVESGRST
jgi:hypothetical protein